MKNIVILFLLTCLTNCKDITSKPIQKNDSVVANIFGKEDLVKIGNKKQLISSNHSAIRTIAFNSLNKGIIVLENGNILLFENESVKDIGTIGGHLESNICLNDKGNGFISYINGDGYLTDDGSVKDKIYLTKIENYSISETKIVDDNLSTALIPNSTIDEEGNGLLVYQRSQQSYYVKKINNYNISQESSIINLPFKEQMREKLVLNNNDISIIWVDKVDSKLKTSYVDSNNNFSMPSILSDNVRKFSINNEIKGNINLLLNRDSNNLELLRIDTSNKIKKYEIKNNVVTNIDSFYINDKGNGFLIDLDNGKILIRKIIDFSVQSSGIYSQERSNLSKGNFSTIIDSNGYIFWNDLQDIKQFIGTPIIYYFKVSIFN